MKKSMKLILVLSIIVKTSISQVVINKFGDTANSSAMLDISSTHDNQ